MDINRIGQLGRVAVGLAVIGGLVALFNVWTDFPKTGTVDWGHVALAIGVPVLMYALMRSAAASQSRASSDFPPDKP